MPDRRFALGPRLAAIGLPPPSAATLETLRDVVDEGVLGASNHVALALPLIARIAADGGDADLAFGAAAETARFIAETRGSAAPIIGNAIDWMLAGVADVPAAARAGLLADRVFGLVSRSPRPTRSARRPSRRGARAHYCSAGFRLFEHRR